MDSYDCHSLRRKKSSNSLEQPNCTNGSKCYSGSIHNSPSDMSRNGNGNSSDMNMSISQTSHKQKIAPITVQSSTISSATAYSLATIRSKGKSNDDHDIPRGRRMGRGQDQGGNESNKYHRSKSIPRQMKYRCSSSSTLNDIDMT